MQLRNCNSKDFIKKLNGKKVICFGAGSTLIEADYEVKKIDGLEKYIAFFVDNDTNKHGAKFKYCNHEFDIKNVNSLKGIDTKKYVLLVTCAFYIEIYHQLKNMPEINNLECYMYNAVCSYPELDVNEFFEKEIEKKAYKEWKQILSQLKLKNKHKGKRCFVIGNGPSLRIEDLEHLKGEITFASNRIFKLFDKTDWRPTYYFCIDYFAYEMDHKLINMIDSKLRFIPIERTLAAGKIYNNITYYNRVVNCVDIRDGAVVRGKKFLFSEDIEEIVYGGQTVLYDAIQFAVYMGFSEIYLLGVDCNYRLEVSEDGTVTENRDVKNEHFCNDYTEGCENTVALVAPIYAFKLAFEKSKEVCERKSITIKNATRGGKLEVFERVDFDRLIDKNPSRGGDKQCGR